MNESHNLDAKWEESITQEYILCDSIYVKYRNRQNDSMLLEVAFSMGERLRLDKKGASRAVTLFFDLDAGACVFSLWKGTVLYIYDMWTVPVRILRLNKVFFYIFIGV